MANENVRRFIHLQERANRMIDAYGQCSEEIAEELEYLGDILSPQEIDEVCSYYNKNKNDCYTNCEY